MWLNVARKLFFRGLQWVMVNDPEGGARISGLERLQPANEEGVEPVGDSANEEGPHDGGPFW